MVDSQMRSRKAPSTSLRLCDEPAAEDGADPRMFFRKEDPSRNHKSKRLCGAAHRTLSLCLPSLLGDDVARGLALESVEPAASAGWILVILRTQQPLDPADRGRVLRALEATRRTLRAEIAAGISRRRVPDLRFLVLGPGELRS